MVDIGCREQINTGKDSGGPEEILLDAVHAGLVTHQVEYENEEILDVQHQPELQHAGVIRAVHGGEGEDAGKKQSAQHQRQCGIDQAGRPDFVVRAGDNEGKRYAVKHIEQHRLAGEIGRHRCDDIHVPGRHDTGIPQAKAQGQGVPVQRGLARTGADQGRRCCQQGRQDQKAVGYRLRLAGKQAEDKRMSDHVSARSDQDDGL